MHVLFSKEKYRDKWYPGKSKKEAYITFIQDLLSVYEIITDNINSYEILMLFLDIIKQLDREYSYIEKIKVHLDLPGFMDIIYFIFADRTCEILITTDRSFKKFEKVQTKKLKKIVILDEELSIEKEISPSNRSKQ
ncbi:MAG TPA: hypothetical protein EYH22_03840 [Candidatus Nanopusillus sp.]|nr:hypothetical protein [Candidatus Nanopusillus sp.]